MIFALIALMKDLNDSLTSKTLLNVNVSCFCFISFAPVRYEDAHCVKSLISSQRLSIS